jgi:hypothetical protein
VCSFCANRRAGCSTEGKSGVSEDVSYLCASEPDDADMGRDHMVALC